MWTKIDSELSDLEEMQLQRAYTALAPSQIGGGLAVHAVYRGIAVACNLIPRATAIDDIYCYGLQTPTGHVLQPDGQWVRPTRQQAGAILAAVSCHMPANLRRAVCRVPRRRDKYTN